MKLTQKISRYFLFSSVLFFILISSTVFLFNQMAISEEVDEQLVNITKKAFEELRQNKEVNFSPFVEVEETEMKGGKGGFSDIDLFIKGKDETEPYRQLVTFLTVNGKNYKCTVRISMLEKREMLRDQSALTIVAVLLMVLIFSFLNNYSSKKLFHAFYTSLDKLKKFSLKEGKKLSFEPSDIDEFAELNRSLEFLSERAVGEYKSLKEFTEEVNHEIQTPIAVIKSKVELLLQNGSLDEQNLQQIVVVLQSLHKLEKINKSILLLNKLDNKLLFESESVSLTNFLRDIILQNEEFCESKNLTVETEIIAEDYLQMNAQLLEVLLQNLVSNAIKHNIEDGKIKIVTEQGKLTVSNSSLEPGTEPAKFFKRFYKESGSTDSTGLGLTIVKKICDLYGFVVVNQFSEGIYSISIKFRENNRA